MKFKMGKGQEPQSNCRCVGGSLFEEMAHRSQYGRAIITREDLHRYVGGTFSYRQAVCPPAGRRRHGVYLLTGKITAIEADFPVVTITHENLQEKAAWKSAWKPARAPLNDDDFVFVMNGWRNGKDGITILNGDNPRIELVLIPPEWYKEKGKPVP